MPCQISNHRPQAPKKDFQRAGCCPKEAWAFQTCWLCLYLSGKKMQFLFDTSVTWGCQSPWAWFTLPSSKPSLASIAWIILNPTPGVSHSWGALWNHGCLAPGQGSRLLNRRREAPRAKHLAMQRPKRRLLRQRWRWRQRLKPMPSHRSRSYDGDKFRLDASGAQEEIHKSCLIITFYDFMFILTLAILDGRYLMWRVKKPVSHVMLT